MRPLGATLLLLETLAVCLDAAAAEPAAAEVRQHRGRPTVFINGVPTALPTYSPMGWSKPHREAAIPAFAKHRMGAYFLAWPRDGDVADLDDQAAFILAHDPDAWFLVRNGRAESKAWRAAHPEELVVDEDGRRLPVPSLASQAGWAVQAANSVKVIRTCEGRPWSHRLIGYWYGLRIEGSHEPMMEHLLFDHSPVMTAAWRAFLHERYGTVEALRQAYGEDGLTFNTVPVPRDRLRGPVPEVSRLLYWQPASENQPLRDYLELNGRLFREGFAHIARATATATDRKRLLLYDAFKQTMLGWSNRGFFNMKTSWPLAYAELMAGSGHLGVAACLEQAEGFSGVITPHDYQVRGVGGICEPEGIVDATVLRGRAFFCEYDMRTYANPSEHGAYGMATDIQAFAAINWRNIATALTRGYNGYWMDLCGQVQGWYGAPEIHRVIERSVEVVRQSIAWPHADVPGIAVIVDDRAVLETNGDGRFFNEALMWELKLGISRCGVPYRVYLLEDLALDAFPEHRLFYFPNLFRVDEERLALLRRKVFRNGHVVLWGPGSGISDGTTLSPRHAERLTGFQFHYVPVNHPRRTHIQNFAHPITRGLPADVIYGSPLAYGPLLYPKNGTELGRAWTKQGRQWSGLSVLEHGRGAAGRDAGDWTSVFTTAVPIPATLWRNLARHAGAHVYCTSNDILLADASVVALHSIQSGPKTLRLPSPARVLDLVTGKPVGEAPTDTLHFELDAPATRLFLLRTAD